MTAAERLKGFADRILRLMADRDDVSSDIKDVFTEVKSAGFNSAALRKVIADARMDQEKREALEFDIDAYRRAIGLPAALAEEMLAEGAGIRETNRATGVALGTLHRRSKKLTKTENGTPERTAAHKPGAVPEGRPTGEASAIPDPIPEPPAGVPLSTTDCDPVAACPPRAVPAGDEDSGWEKADSAGNYQVALAVLADRAREARSVAALADDPGPMPEHLRAGSAARAAITGRR